MNNKPRPKDSCSSLTEFALDFKRDSRTDEQNMQTNYKALQTAF